MSRLLLIATAALVATSAFAKNVVAASKLPTTPNAIRRLAAPTAITAAEFCGEYETQCGAIGKKFDGADAPARKVACETFYNAADPGTLGDPITSTANGATKACFQNHLSLAADGAQAAHCPHAKGTTTCVAPAPVALTAVAFCESYKTKCGDKKFDPDTAKSKAACETFYTGAAAGALGNPITSTANGATKACFQYHLSLANGAAAATHCPHAKGTTACVAPAPVPLTAVAFCESYTTKCGDKKFDPDTAKSKAACEKFYTGAAAGTLGNPITSTANGATKACFQYHLSLAIDAASKTTHCPHAKGTTACVAPAPKTTPTPAPKVNGDGGYEAPLAALFASLAILSSSA